MDTIPEYSQVSVQVTYDFGVALLRVVQYGRDFPELVRFRLQER